MPRRIYTYDAGQGWEIFNHDRARRARSSQCVAGAHLRLQLLSSRKSGEIAGNDPWGAPTLEWSIPSPPPEYNFADDPDRDVALSAVGREVAGADGRGAAQPARR